MKYTTADLFAGIGGIRIGFERAGFHTVYANDFDAFAKTTYDANFANVKMDLKDIKKVEASSLPKFDILLGGFPCQPFSIAGYRKGLNDSGRGDLFFDILRLLKKEKEKDLPLAFMLENVKNLYSHDKGNTYKFMKSELESLGYKVTEKILNTMEYGNVPQNRERIYIVGFKEQKHRDNFEFPSKIELEKSVSDLLEDNVDSKYYYEGKLLFDKLKDTVVNKNTVYQWRRVYVRENKKGVSPTLTANMGTGGHNVPIIFDGKGIRKLTPRECARLQGFPDDYQLPIGMADSRLYKQIGNSVSIPVVSRVAENIMKALQN